MTIYRSFLFAPGNHPRRVQKSFTLGADAVILDLEDAVPIAEKAAAREAVMAALQAPRAGLGYVRVNALGTPWACADLLAAVAPGVDGIVLPKVESAADVHAAEWLIGALERDRGLAEGRIDLIATIETAAGLCRIEEIVRAARRVRRLAFGAGDFTTDLGLTWTDDEQELLSCRSTLVAQSRAAGLEPPIDTVWAALSDPAGFERSACRGRQLGFQGKLCIHPDQVPVVNACFLPDPDEVARARRVVAAFAEAERAGLAAIQVDGQFVDYPIVHRARRVLAQFEAAGQAAQGRSGLAGSGPASHGEGRAAR